MEENFEPEEMDLDMEYDDFNQLIANEDVLANRRELVGADRRSKPVLGKLAQAHLVQIRAAQIANGEKTRIPPNIPLESGEAEAIARQELKLKILPIKVVRIFPNGTFEKWSLQDFK